MKLANPVLLENFQLRLGLYMKPPVLVYAPLVCFCQSKEPPRCYSVFYVGQAHSQRFKVHQYVLSVLLVIFRLLVGETRVVRHVFQGPIQ